MAETDKNKIPRDLNAPGARDQNGKEVSMEQVVVNSMVTIAAALAEISEGINDVCATLDIIKDIEVKRAANEGLLAPDEVKELLSDDEDAENEQPE
jgi:hypothetical protein